MCRVGRKTWGEPTPESLLVTLSRLCEVVAGAVSKGLIGNGIGSSVSCSVKLFNFLVVCSRNR